MKKKKKIVILNWLVNIGITILFVYGMINGIDDLTNGYKIEKTIENTKELRIALEKYYEIAGKYPDLTKPNVNNNLYLLDYTDKSGKKISFVEIYGRNSLAKTYGNGVIIATNKVYDIDNFKNGNKMGGWNYNFSKNTGEIHPNLLENVYSEKVNWNRQ